MIKKISKKDMVLIILIICSFSLGVFNFYNYFKDKKAKDNDPFSHWMVLCPQDYEGQAAKEKLQKENPDKFIIWASCLRQGN